MCGVVGAKISSPKNSDIELLKRVFLETEIRGKHASGVAWFNGKDISIVSKPITISEFLKDFSFEQCIVNDELSLIGHIRYSTSDLKFNQPIGDNEFCIVHNGVISQEGPENWDKRYSYKTRNDTEILWNCLKNNRNYNEDYKGCSVSVVSLDKDGNISNSRNGLRPQWKGTLENGYIIASTRNILKRAGFKDESIEKVLPNSDEKIHRDMG